MSDINYAVEIYEYFLRDLIKDIAREYPDNSKDKLEAELEYIKRKLEDKKLGFLFDSIFNEHTFYRCLNSQENHTSESRSSMMYSYGVDVDSIREKCNKYNSKDIVWILQDRGGKYPRQKEKVVNDKNSRDQFESLLEQIGLSDKEKQIFYCPSKEYHSNGWKEVQTFCFNGLIDNGNIIYNRQFQDEKSIALSAREIINLPKMHEKLKKLLEAYNEINKNDSTQETIVRNIVTIADNLSDLIPIIDKDSKLKSKEQLEDERIAMRYAVLKKFLMQRIR